MRRRHLAALLVATVAVLALLSWRTEHAARADTTGTPTPVGAFGCIVDNGGHVTRPARSMIVIHQGIGEQTLGIMTNYLGAETTVTSVNDGQMSDVSNQWAAPVFSGGFWFSSIDVPTGVTLAQPGDQVRFTFTLLLSSKVPEIFNPGAGGQAGQPTFNGPGLVFGGTCTVTAT